MTISAFKSVLNFLNDKFWFIIRLYVDTRVLSKACKAVNILIELFQRSLVLVPFIYTNGNLFIEIFFEICNNSIFMNRVYFFSFQHIE